MADNDNEPKGPDLAQGIAAAELAEGGMLAGHVGDEAVLLVRHGGKVAALAAHCTHYDGPLADGLIVGDTIRCPWHHACFDLRTGEALAAPALSPPRLLRGRASATAASSSAPRRISRKPQRPSGVRSASSSSAAAPPASPRRRCCGGAVRRRASPCCANDSAAPVDRPNLSKDYLAGTRAGGLGAAARPTTGTPTTASRCAEDRGRRARCREAQDASRSATARRCGFDTLLLATGAEPVRLPIPGAELPHVHVLRSLADSRAIIARRRRRRKRAVIIGASFIGLEVAAALRARDIDVHVVAPEKRPLERVLGPELGDFVRALHEEHGVVLPSRATASPRIERRSVDARRAAQRSTPIWSSSASACGRDSALAEKAGLAIDRGVVVDAIPRDQRARHLCRRRHRALARSRYGRAHPRRALGGRRAAGPDRGAQHAGRARRRSAPCRSSGASITTCRSTMSATPKSWDAIEIDGDVMKRDCLVRYRKGGKRAGHRLDLPRSREPGGRGRDGERGGRRGILTAVIQVTRPSSGRGRQR